MPVTDDAPGATGFTATELEERLRAPDGARLRAELLARLGVLSQRLAADMNSGLPTSDFGRADAVAKALASAQVVLAKFPAARHDVVVR